MEKNKILLLGIVVGLSLSLSGCHMQRQPDRSSPAVENDNVEYSETTTADHFYWLAPATEDENSTISEFQETHQDLIAEIEYESSRAEERIAMYIEEFVEGIWESVQDSDETVEMIDGSFTRRINDEVVEVVEKGYLYTYVSVGREDLRQIIATEHEMLLNELLENVKETNFENFGWTTMFGFIVVDYRDEIVDHRTHSPLVWIRFTSAVGGGIEPRGIYVNGRAFRRPQ